MHFALKHGVGVVQDGVDRVSRVATARDVHARIAGSNCSPFIGNGGARGCAPKQQGRMAKHESRRPRFALPTSAAGHRLRKLPSQTESVDRSRKALRRCRTPLKTPSDAEKRPNGTSSLRGVNSDGIDLIEYLFWDVTESAALPLTGHYSRSKHDVPRALWCRRDPPPAMLQRGGRCF